MARRRKRRASKTTTHKKRTLTPEQLEKMRQGRERAAQRRAQVATMEKREKALDELGLPSEHPRGRYEKMLDDVRRRDER